MNNPRLSRPLTVVMLAVVAAVATQSCWLPSFEIDSATASGGVGGEGGGAPRGGERASGGGGGAAGRGPEVTAPRLVADTYVFRQGSQETFVVPASKGVLANDAPVGLQVISSSDRDPLRPSAFDAAFEISADGGLEFRPKARFFGDYHLSYTVQSAHGATAIATLTIRILPSRIDLDAVSQGIGGYVLHGGENSNFGAALDRAFDVNKDGLRDLIVGAPTSRDGDGAAFVVFGKTDLEPIEVLPLALGSKELRYAALSGGPGEGVGVAVAGLGDLDGDGAGDVVVSSGAGLGRAHVALSGGLASAVTLPALQGITIEGDAANTELGRVVRGVSDVNGDGLSDLLLSSKNVTTSGSTTVSFGWAHVLFGNASWRDRSIVAGVSALHVHVRAAENDDPFPLAAAGVGDLDKDGRAEVLLSAGLRFSLLSGGSGYPADVGMLGSDGRAGGWNLVRAAAGDAPVAGLGDVNADTFADVGYCDGFSVCRVVFGPPVVLAAGWNIKGLTRQAPVSMAGGGDLDGDGLSDVLLADARSAYVVYGRRAGFEDVELGALGEAGFSISAASGGKIGAVSIIGDANGDGVDDLALADRSADRGAGRVYVVFGVPSR